MQPVILYRRPLNSRQNLTSLHQCCKLRLQLPVFLLTTGSSRFKEELIDKFSKFVERKNGKFPGMIFIRRGRIYWQKIPDEVNEEVREALKTHIKIWPVTAKGD